MKGYIKTALVLLLVLLVQEVSLAATVWPDIRYRSIVYFYPGAGKADTSLLETQYKGFKVVAGLPDKALEPVVSYAVVEDAGESYPVPDLNYLAYFGRGMDKQQATRIQDATRAVVIDVAYPELASRKNLRAAASALFNFARSSGGLIWDSETRELFTPEAWGEARINSWGEAGPNVEDHIVIHVYQSDEGVRAITLGMARFGVPDVVVNNFSWSLNQSMGNLINLAAQLLAEGAAPDEEGFLALDVNKLKNTEYKKSLIPTLKDNAQSGVKVLVGEGKWEEGDPNNYLIELLFHNVPGESLSEKQEALVSSLFGWEDQITYVEHNALIKEASSRARDKLDKLRAAFNDGLDPGEYILVKVPFRTPEGGNEYMWVEIQSWQGAEITGLLKNEPYHIPTLKGGSEVVVSQQDVFDYIRRYPNGTSEGNETGALIEKFGK